MKLTIAVSTSLVVTILGLVLPAVPPRVYAAEAPSVEIKIDNFSFGAQTVTVAVGTQVTWINRDDIPHTVVSEDQTTFKSRPLDTDEKFSFTFTKAGSYNYFCSIHPKMMAKIIVQ